VVPLPSSPTDYELNAAGLELAEFVTANCFVRREALARIGGFDERFTAAWREDSDLQFTLLEQGADIATAPEAVVLHPVRPAPWGVCLGQQAKSFFEALLYKKHPRLYRDRIRPAFPWDYYVIALSLGFAILALAAGAAEIASIAAAVWAWFTARFCALRLRGTSRAPRHIAEMIVTSLVIPLFAIYWRLYGAAKHRVLFL
jgi:hypothetical protein